MSNQVELTQGSELWHEFRNKGIGSSDIATIMNLNPYKTREELFKEKTGQITPPDISKNYSVARGSALEPLARNIFNERMNLIFEPAVFQDDYMKYSSDGFNKERNEIIEIKALGSKNHNKVLLEKTPLDYYMPQCQWGMMISKAKKCYFISYNPEFEENLISLEILPNFATFEIMKQAASKFWDEWQDYLSQRIENV